MFKRVLSVLAAIMMATLIGCGAKESESTQPESTRMEGLFLNVSSGAMIVIDNCPCTLGGDESLYEEFTDGDVVAIYFDGMIAESYPGQINSVYNAELVSDGEITDIDEDILASLRELGYIE